MAGAQSKQPGPKSLQKALILMHGYAPCKKGPLYTQRLAEHQAVEGVPRGPPWPPDQLAQGLCTGLPLPQLRRVQGATKPAPLAEHVSSSRGEPLRGSGVAGTPSELETHKHLREQRTPWRQETAWGPGEGQEAGLLQARHPGRPKGQRGAGPVTGGPGGSCTRSISWLGRA